jgi:RNA polymerase sigma factor (sigma-70 family)
MTREGYGQAYQEGLNRTVRFLLSRGAKQDSAADIAQSAWLHGWERLSQLRDERRIVTWVNTIALNQYRRAIQREHLHQPLGEVVYGESSLNWAAIDLSRILRFCRPQDRMLLEAQLGGRTAQEIARERGVSQTAIRIRLLRARRAARKAAERMCTFPGPNTPKRAARSKFLRTSKPVEGAVATQRAVA